MSRRSDLRKWLPAALRPTRPVALPARPRLGLEALEDRAVPATVQVVNTNDAGGGSLRQAILDVNASADATNTITFLPGLFGTINVTSADLQKIAKPVDIQGPGAALITVSGAGTKALFNIDDATATAIAVSISGLKITAGKSAAGGGVFSQNETVTLREVVITANASTGNGGGIQANGGSVTLLNSQVTNNTATDGAGIRNAGATFVITGSQIENNTATGAGGTGGYYQSGGALQDMTNSSVSGNQGGLGGGLYVTGGPSTIVNSLIANNRATNAGGTNGGGLAVAGGTVVLKNVTVSGNLANNDGGGVWIGTTGSLEIDNSTVAFNKSDTDNAGGGSGGGLFVTAGKTVKLVSTIVAKNDIGTTGANKDVSGAADGTSAFNLIGIDTGLTGITNATQGNLIGTAGTPRDPLLSVLAFNGGITKTHAIAGTSNAKDAGDITALGAAVTTDGRGAPFARVVGAKADIGAYELPTGPVTVIVTTVADENDATFDAATTSLREALRIAGTDAPTITFDPSLGGKAITLTRGRLTIDRAVAVQGPGAKQLTLNGNNLFQIIRVDDGVTGSAIDVSVSGLTLTAGKADPNTGGDLFGGAMRTFENVTLDGMVITGNVATNDSGGIDHQFGNLTVTNSTVSNNKSGTVAGGIGNFGGGTVSVKNSTVSGNQANGTDGGGIFNVGAGTIVVSNSTISGNAAKNDGGGIFASAGTLIVNNSTVAFNTADADNAGGGKGGGISFAGATAKMIGTVVAKNSVGTTGANPDLSGKIDATFSLVLNTTGWDQSGSSNNKLNADPLLAALADNGGPTQTHLPAAAGPGVDPGFTDAQINPDGLTSDQRGFARKVGAGVDIGAVEFAVNTNPTVSDIPNQPTTAVGAAIGPITFTVADAETPVANLTLAGLSNNTALVPTANIVFGGTAGSKTVTVTPAAGQSGTATITVTVSDANGGTATDTFTVTVSATNTNPTVSDVPNQPTTAVGAVIGPITFTVGDAETPVANLTLAGTSDNTALVPNASIVFGGSGANRTVTVTPAAGQSGTATITLTVNDTAGGTATDTFTVTVTPPAAANRVALVGVPLFAVGTDGGGGSVNFYNPDKSLRASVTPFGTFTGGVRTAAADFNGDGVADIVAGTGPGRATRVVILDGVTKAELFGVDPFEAAFTGGVYVTAGDLDGDGRPDLVITPDEGGGPRVDIYSGKGFGKLASFFGIDDPNFRGGARAATGDMTGDGRADLIVVAGFGGGPRVAGFNGTSLGGTPSRIFGDFFAFEQSLRNGIFVTVGDLDGDGNADLIAGGGPGGGPRVLAFSGKGLINGNQLNQLANFFGGDPNSRGGIRLAVKDLDGDNRADLVVGAGAGAGSRVTSYLGKSIPTDGPPAENFAFEAVAGFTGGVFVG